MSLKVCSLFACLCTLCACKTIHKPTISGETNYTKKEEEHLRTNLMLKYKADLYESPDKKWLLHAGGSVSGDYDHFGTTIKMNTFSSVGIDF